MNAHLDHLWAFVPLVSVDAVIRTLSAIQALTGALNIFTILWRINADNENSSYVFVVRMSNQHASVRHCT